MSNKPSIRKAGLHDYATARRGGAGQGSGRGAGLGRGSKQVIFGLLSYEMNEH